MSLTNDIKPKFYLNINGNRCDGSFYSINLGPWDSSKKAEGYSDSLTDTRIGEQLLMKLGVKELHVYEA